MSDPTAAPTAYDFEAETQTALAKLVMWDDDFNRRTLGLIKPEYFSNQIEGTLVGLSQDFFNKYGEAPTSYAWAEIIKNAVLTKRLRDDEKKDAIAKIKETHGLTVLNRDWFIEKTCEFAKQNAIINAMASAIPLLQKAGDVERFAKIEKLLGTAFAVAPVERDDDYDYFERITERTDQRIEVAAGGGVKTGVTTGVKELDDILLHRGWGRRELSALIGGAKSSKSFHLSFFAAKAVESGYNALLISLENSTEVTATRIDAMFSEVGISEQYSRPHAMDTGVKAASAKPGMGKLRIRRRRAGSFTPNDLKVMIDEYKAKGIKFDLVVIDYIDIMAPNRWTQDNIQNSKSICVDIRQVADDENFAVLSAFQTNREGHKSSVVRAENVAEDFNRIRIPDLVLGINRTEDERAEQKARITFVAARNQADGYTLFVKQDLDHGMAISSVESVE